MKKIVQKAFLEPQSRIFVLTNDFLTLVTLVSVLAIVLETMPVLSSYSYVFLIIEYVSVAIFTLEYIGRYMVARKKTDYTLSFFGLVDLVAILPTYVGFANLTFLKTARVLRIMRFLRMVRLTKLARMRTRRKDVEDYASLYKLNLQLYFAALFATVLAFGSLMYIVEAPYGTFTSVPSGMQWALETILGGSISQAYPQTVLGEIVSILTRFAGLVLLGLLITVVGTVARKLIFGSDDLGVEKQKAKK